MIREVTSEFNKWIHISFQHKREIVEFLWNHERKEKCINELCNQIKICEKKGKRIKFDVFEYKMVIKETAKLFARMALKKAEEDEVSKIERQLRIDKAGEMDDIEAMFDEDQKEALSNKTISYPTTETI